MSATELTSATNPLHEPGSPHEHWTTDNVGEAAPGVLTPLSWSVWGPIGDRMMREVGYSMGVLDRAERRRADDSYYRIFFGRCAMRVDYLALVGDRMPGTTGEAAVTGLLGRAPADLAYAPTRRRYPIIAGRLPWLFFRAPRRLRPFSVATDRWWRDEIECLPTLSFDEAVETFRLGVSRFEQAITLQSQVLLAVVQPLFDRVSKLVDRTGIGDVSVLSGSGGAEMAIVAELWRASRGESDLDQLVRDHGFHGPLEGELSSRVWREDETPLRRLVKEYAARDDSADPRLGAQDKRRRLSSVQADIVAALPRSQRPAARALLRLAATRILLRGVAKRSFLQSLDVARGAARRAGEHLAREGRLEDPDDVFYLVADELTGPLPPDLAALVAERRAIRAVYERLAIPSDWQGTPTPQAATDGDGAGGEQSLTGIGVSAGVVEGTARVVRDPATEEIEPGEILVAATTDPSWSAILFVSSALVVDIGGPLSHAAVVARELGVPCVVNTRVGTQRLRSGDHVRVDGTNGSVEVLEHASSP